MYSNAKFDNPYLQKPAPVWGQSDEADNRCTFRDKRNSRLHKGHAFHPIPHLQCPPGSRLNKLNKVGQIE
jgi:hypothetical protein